MSSKTHLKFLLFFVSVVVGLFVVEVLLRLFYPFPFGYVKGGVVADSQLCYRLPENFSTTVHTLDYPHTTGFTTTEFGTRTTGTYAKNLPTILLLGDSFTQGIQVNDNETFSSISQQGLPGYNVLNYGVLGYNPYQYLLLLNKTIRQFNTSYVILNFYVANDFVLPVDDVRKGCSISEFGGYLMTSDSSARSWFFMFRQFLHHNTHVYNFLTDRLSGQFVKKFLHVLGLSTNNPDSPEALLFVQNENADRYFENTFAVLEEIRQLAMSQNATFILVVIPARYHLLPELWNAFWKQYGKSGQPDVIRPYKKIVEYGQQKNMTVLNMYDAFSQNSPEQFYGIRDDHYSRKGHEKHAEILLSIIA